MIPKRIRMGSMSVPFALVQSDMGLRSIDVTLLQTRTGRLQARVTPGAIVLGPMQAAAAEIPRAANHSAEGHRWCSGGCYRVHSEGQRYPSGQPCLLPDGPSPGLHNAHRARTRTANDRM